MIESVATRPQKDQLNRNASTAIPPKMLVNGGDVAVSQCEVALHVEFRQSGGQAILSDIAKFRTWHLLPPMKVARSAVAGRYVIAGALAASRQHMEPMAVL